MRPDEIIEEIHRTNMKDEAKSTQSTESQSANVICEYEKPTLTKKEQKSRQFIFTRNQQ